MDPSHLARLQEQQELALTETEDKINQLKKFQTDYEALRDRLETLADEVSYDVMVPFGRLAFMPGKLVHTNEVLVLLGDNWFAERSAKQASGIISRRMEGLSTQLDELEKQKKLLRPHRQFTEELQQLNQEVGDVVEICEDYDEEAERQWRVVHQESVRKARQAEKEMQSELAKKLEGQRPLTDKELWARLDELERQEEEGGEMNRDEEERSQEESSSEESSEDEDEEEADGDRHVQWKDERPDRLRTHATIYFSHGQPAEQPGALVWDTGQVTLETGEENGGDSTHSHTPPEPQQIISSPSDIYKHFYKPKSILKPPSTEGVSGTSNPKPKAKTTSSKAKPAVWLSESVETPAFLGEIVEHKTTPPVKALEPSVSAAPRRVSKFKAQRLQEMDR